MYYTLEKYNTRSTMCHNVAWFQLHVYTNSHNTKLPKKKKKSTVIHEVSLHNVNVLCGKVKDQDI